MIKSNEIVATAIFDRKRLGMLDVQKQLTARDASVGLKLHSEGDAQRKSAVCGMVEDNHKRQPASILESLSPHFN